MIDLAMWNQTGPVSLSKISQRQSISLSYLEQLFCKLRRFDIVYSVRGVKGGYKLAKQANKITIREIVIAVNERIDTTKCMGQSNCRGKEKKQCISHNLWVGLNQKITEYLETITLASLVKQYKESASLCFVKF